MSAPTLPANTDALHDGVFDVARTDPVATTTGWTRAARTALKDEGLVRFREAVTKKILKSLISSNLNVSSYKASEMEDKNNFFNAIASWSGSSLQLQSWMRTNFMHTVFAIMKKVETSQTANDGTVTTTTTIHFARLNTPQSSDDSY